MWYQTTIRELLWLTTLVAVVFSVLKTFGVPALWSAICALGALVGNLWPLVEPFLDFRSKCKEHGIWDLPGCSTEEDYYRYKQIGSSSRRANPAQP